MGRRYREAPSIKPAAAPEKRIPRAASVDAFLLSRGGTSLDVAMDREQASPVSVMGHAEMKREPPPRAGAASPSRHKLELMDSLRQKRYEQLRRSPSGPDFTRSGMLHGELFASLRQTRRTQAHQRVANIAAARHPAHNAPSYRTAPTRRGPPFVTGTQRSASSASLDTSPTRARLMPRPATVPPAMMMLWDAPSPRTSPHPARFVSPEKAIASTSTLGLHRPTPLYAATTSAPTRPLVASASAPGLNAGLARPASRSPCRGPLHTAAWVWQPQ